MDKYIIEVKLYQIKDQFNERKITAVKFDWIIVNKIHQFYDGNGRMFKILFANIKWIFIVLNAQYLQKTATIQ